MLNVCMERRSIREGGLPFAMTLKKMRTDSCKEDSEDEFYDCANEDEEGLFKIEYAFPVGQE